MFQVGIKDRFRAGHYLRGDFGEEARPHEHDYVVEWICSTSGLDQNGFSVDIALAEELLAATVHEIQGALLNELEFFAERQPSVENMARYLHRKLFDALEGRSYPVSTILQSEIKIWESDTAWASYAFP
ncbi:MAG: 6-carboxytetrahydropterin synthase [Spirochaetales bacterium]|nr:6-carboxytetrahydropterin synthase [Spirochaetales bacterium]